MGKGGYTGGSTFLGPSSSWFRQEDELDYPDGRSKRVGAKPDKLKEQITQWATKVCWNYMKAGKGTPRPSWLPGSVRQEIERRGSLRAWASERPEWEQVRRDIEHEERRKLFLLQVAQWIAGDKEKPAIPSTIGPKSLKSIEKLKDLEKWARAQPDFGWAIKKAAGSQYKDFL